MLFLYAPFDGGIMKLGGSFLLIILVFTFQAKAAQVSKECSYENVKKLLTLTAVAVGEVGAENIKITHLFTRSEYAKSNLDQLKKQFFEIHNESSLKSGKIAEEIGAFVKAHPECDIDHLFTVKK